MDALTEMSDRSKRAGFYTTKGMADLFSVSTRTIQRWVKKGLIEPRLQFLGGTHLRFVFFCSEVSAFLDKKFPTPRTLDDPRILKILESRRGYAKKASAAARMAKGKASGKG